MHLTLVIPELLWPNAYDGVLLNRAQPSPSTPALNVLLGRGRLTPAAPTDLDTALAVHCFGHSPPPPYAALRLLGEVAIPPQAGHWLCADPVHLHLQQENLLLADGNSIRITASEAQNLSEDLNRHFATAGKFYAAAPTRWYMCLHSPITFTAPPLAAVAGHRLTHQLPEQSHTSELRHLLNEIQMFMHQHPINQARVEQGLPSINSLWLWGGGELHSKPSTHFDHVYGTYHLLSGLAKHKNTPVHTQTPENFAALSETHKHEPHSHVLILLDDLQNSLHHQDIFTWATQLQKLEQHWFAPLRQAISSNKIALTLLGITAYGTLSWKISATDIWKIWHPPKSPLSLISQLSASAHYAH